MKRNIILLPFIAQFELLYLIPPPLSLAQTLIACGSCLFNYHHAAGDEALTFSNFFPSAYSLFHITMTLAGG